MAGRTTQPGQSVTGRVLSILAVFERSLAPRSLSDISAETGLPLSTTHRLVGELEDWGALQRDDNGRYQIGLRLWELGQHAGRQVREIARPLLLTRVPRPEAHAIAPFPRIALRAENSPASSRVARQGNSRGAEMPRTRDSTRTAEPPPRTSRTGR